MNILIRQLRLEDFEVYRRCFSNTEFKHFMFGDKDIDIEFFFLKMLKNTQGTKDNYILFYSNDGQTTTNIIIGFCNFVKYDKYPFKVNKETYAINGGLLPLYFNKGLGVYACVSILNIFFLKHPNADLYASTFEDNIRSVRMLEAVGFKQMGQKWYNKNHLMLDSNRFYDCNLSSRILSRVRVTIEG